ncbi:MAG: HAD family hydrolase [Bacteroidota bacterium]
MVLIFDLDDTLYDETTYVKSGFKAVAQFLNKQFQLPEKKVFLELMDELKKGRGQIFDTILRKHKLYTKKLAKKCITVYRFHIPSIQLSQSGINCLRRFKKYPIYIVTDGNKIVQYNKIKALGVDKLVKGYYITHRYGIHNAKPSVHCFMKISEREKVSPDKVVYIADNISKDFVGIKARKFKTVQVLTGQYSTIKKPKEYQADIKIKSLNELTEKLASKIFNSK